MPFSRGRRFCNLVGFYVCRLSVTASRYLFVRFSSNFNTRLLMLVLKPENITTYHIPSLDLHFMTLIMFSPSLLYQLTISCRYFWLSPLCSLSPGMKVYYLGLSYYVYIYIYNALSDLSVVAGWWSAYEGHHWYTTIAHVANQKSSDGRCVGDPNTNGRYVHH